MLKVALPGFACLTFHEITPSGIALSEIALNCLASDYAAWNYLVFFFEIALIEIVWKSLD